MKKEIAEKWVKALRSGEYKQTTEGCLFDGEAYCCLGVLCDISEKGHWHNNGSFYDDSGNGDAEILTVEIREWSGMKWENGYTGRECVLKFNDKHFYTLASANDAGMPFTEIANFIERNYEKL